ncbi:MAG: trypsin-like peptidase domain-containing protein [Xanthobacteraceae bacterium]
MPAGCGLLRGCAGTCRSGNRQRLHQIRARLVSRLPASRSNGQEDELCSFGSSVLVDPVGLVTTSSHGSQTDSHVKVALADKREFNAGIVAMDRRTDLAVLCLQGVQDLARIEIGDSDKVQVGDFVLAIGNPGTH